MGHADVTRSDVPGVPRRRGESGPPSYARASHAAIDVDGYTPRLRTGIHHGRPRKIAGDWSGVDVNVAAHLAEAAGPGEILVSDTAWPTSTSRAVGVRTALHGEVRPSDLGAHAIARPT